MVDATLISVTSLLWVLGRLGANVGLAIIVALMYIATSVAAALRNVIGSLSGWDAELNATARPAG